MVSCLMVLGLLAVWVGTSATGGLMEQLKVLQFWSLEAGLAAVIVSGVLLVRELRSDLVRADLIALVAVAALSLVVSLGVAPRTNRIFYDEQIYQSIGQNMADLRLAQVCNDGSVEYGRLRCDAGQYNKQPYAYPHLLSVAYRLVGLRPIVAFALNALASALTTAAVYLLTLQLFASRDAALCAAVLFALLPEQAMWAATAAVEPTASMASVLALLAAARHRLSGSAASLAACVFLFVWAVQFRPESLLIAPVALAILWARLPDDIGRQGTWWIALLGIVLASTHVAHLAAVRNIPWGSAGARFALAFLPGNLAVNGWFYIWDERFPTLVTLLAIAALAMAWRDHVRWSVALWFAIYFGIDLVFYAGSYNYGADVRYALMTFPPIAVLAGLGAAAAISAAARMMPAVPVRTAAGVLVLFQFLWYAPVVRATTEEGWAARADVRFAESVARELPHGSYVLTHNPGMFHVWGINAGQMSRVVGNERFLQYLAGRYPGGVYLHWNFWCNVDDAVQPEFCRKALAMVPTTLAHEHRERDQRFAFYRLNVSGSTP